MTLQEYLAEMNLTKPTPLQKPFFIAQIVLGCVFMLLHIRLVVVICTTDSLSDLPTYRVIQHISLACLMSLSMRVLGAACTLNGEMDDKWNDLFGALYQCGWAAECPTILVLASNRLFSLVSSTWYQRVWTTRVAYVPHGEEGSEVLIILCCWLFGVFYGSFCITPHYRVIWQVSPPGFFFVSDNSSLSIILVNLDYYLSEAVIYVSLLCYILMFLFLFVKRTSLSLFKTELPQTIYFGTMFAISAIVVYLWHHPRPENLYGHVANLITLLREEHGDRTRQGIVVKFIKLYITLQWNAIHRPELVLLSCSCQVEYQAQPAEIYPTRRYKYLTKATRGEH
ncbi:unnamed protein product [Cylicocyclus nassatus]|uniref:Uncharacterized protein n=1 Tax=Cylicocyclus nassatus TaxID=53992 RepID=A0AA36M2X8_CYLNA|nr:unnamed protein product [Cylicocyclus nassatus]